MKYIIYTTLLLAILVGVYSYTFQEKEKESILVSEGGITFFTGTWKEALAKAKAENKTIFLDAYASWCGPCKMMKRFTFSDSKVGEYYNANFINVMIDMEKGEGIELSTKFNVMAYPTLLFINGDGNVVHEEQGYHTPEQFIALGKLLKK